MVQKIEIEKKKGWYAGFEIDNKSYLCKYNQLKIKRP
jgi:hypothetical protein